MTVILLSWLLIVVGGFDCYLGLHSLSFRLGAVGLGIVGLSAIAAGAFMLRRRNWARWLALAWMALHAVFALLRLLPAPLAHLLILGLIAYGLFNPAADAWFHAAPAKPGARGQPG